MSDIKKENNIKEEQEDKNKVVDFLKDNSTEFLAYLELRKKEIGEMSNKDILDKANEFMKHKVDSVKTTSADTLKGIQKSFFTGIKAAENLYDDALTKVKGKINHNEEKKGNTKK